MPTNFLRLTWLIATAVSAAAPAGAECLRQQSRVTGRPEGALQSICHLSTERRPGGISHGTYNGSAVLYRRQYLVTAAHNVYSPFYNPVTRLLVACGIAEPNRAAHQEIPISRTRVAPGYWWRRFHRDFAVIRLPQPIDVDQPLRLGEIGDGSGPLRVRSAGFPDDLVDGTPMNGWRMFCGSGTAAPRSGGSLLDYDVETLGGNSGGAVWTEGAEGVELVGIHVSGTDGGTGVARIVNREFVTDLNRMIAELGD
jgi:V8-like Glu-specific endopeptidase